VNQNIFANGAGREIADLPRQALVLLVGVAAQDSSIGSAKEELNGKAERAARCFLI
jgi:hypothetical protein